MNWLLFMFMLEVGFLPQGGGLVMYDSEGLREMYPNVDRSYGYTDLQAELQFFNFLFVGGGVKTMVFSHFKQGKSFFPYEADYNFNVGVRFRGVEMGFRHYCIHPVIPWVGYFRDYEPVWEGTYEEIYLRIGTWRGTNRRW